MIPRKTLTVSRRSAGTYVDGLWVEGSESAFTVQASVQPLSPKEVLLLPEGRRTEQSFVLLTDTELNVTTSTNPDTVTIYGRKFEILKVEQWQNTILPHYRCVAVSMPEVSV